MILQMFNYFMQFHSFLSLSLLVLLLPGVSSTLNVIVLTFLVCLKNSYLSSKTLPGITCYHSHFCMYHFHTLCVFPSLRGLCAS